MRTRKGPRLQLVRIMSSVVITVWKHLTPSKFDDQVESGGSSDSAIVQFLAVNRVELNRRSIG